MSANAPNSLTIVLGVAGLWLLSPFCSFRALVRRRSGMTTTCRWSHRRADSTPRSSFVAASRLGENSEIQNGLAGMAPIHIGAIHYSDFCERGPPI
jgi:hypothetical protein